MNRPGQVPHGHPWSCSGCQVVASVIRAGDLTEIHLEHEDHCSTFAARLRELAPDIYLDTAATIRPGTATDLNAVDSMFPRW
jgi:hypothetical protein